MRRRVLSIVHLVDAASSRLNVSFPLMLRPCATSVDERLQLFVLVKLFPLLVLCACASTAPLPMADQPGLAQLAEPYAEQLQAVGISRVISPGDRAMVRLETGYGAVYVRYPEQAAPLAFVLDIDPDGLRATAAKFEPAKDGPMLAALVPEAVRVTVANNMLGWLRANPWH